MLRRFHLMIGLAGVLAFLLTGQYMHWAHAHLQGMADGPRLIFRSTHIYLMWAALLNLCLGCYIRNFTKTPAKITQWIGSMALIAAPPMLCWSFFYERYNQELERPIGHWAIYLALAGTILHVIASLLRDEDN